MTEQPLLLARIYGRHQSMPLLSLSLREKAEPQLLVCCRSFTSRGRCLITIMASSSCGLQRAGQPTVQQIKWP